MTISSFVLYFNEGCCKGVDEWVEFEAGFKGRIIGGVRELGGFWREVWFKME